eukprot:TRINITY_DN10700_c0_g1_i4.p1 TRINITY_DN10700_c0_g1~~TRINITY_DN10700_c0_g1_i4.p1  ORF type:complete len:510 (+),score=58.57 TRINITY_DN10700_c0_g1_i4:57-1586(+)
MRFMQPPLLFLAALAAFLVPVTARGDGWSPERFCTELMGKRWNLNFSKKSDNESDNMIDPNKAEAKRLEKVLEAKLEEDGIKLALDGLNVISVKVGLVFGSCLLIGFVVATSSIFCSSRVQKSLPILDCLFDVWHRRATTALIALIVAGGGAGMAYEVLKFVKGSLNDLNDFFLGTLLNAILDKVVDELNELPARGINLILPHYDQQGARLPICNPTDEPVIFKHFNVEGRLFDSAILDLELVHPKPLTVPPMSLEWAGLIYKFSNELIGVAVEAGMVLARDELTRKVGLGENVADISVLIDAHGVVRSADVGLGVTMFFPLDVAKTPKLLELAKYLPSMTDNELYIMMYGSLLSGYEKMNRRYEKMDRNREYRAMRLEWLELNGAFMFYVYGLVIFAGFITVCALFLLTRAVLTFAGWDSSSRGQAAMGRYGLRTRSAHFRFEESVEADGDQELALEQVQVQTVGRPASEPQDNSRPKRHSARRPSIPRSRIKDCEADTEPVSPLNQS